MFAVPLIKIEIKARHRNGATKRGAEEKKLPRRGYLTEIQAVFRIILLMESLLNQWVSVVTIDGKIIIGILTAQDPNWNIVLTNAFERIFSLDDATTKEPLGLYLIRGDSVGLIGLLDKCLDDELDYTSIKAKPLQPILH